MLERPTMTPEQKSRKGTLDYDGGFASLTELNGGSRGCFPLFF